MKFTLLGYSQQKMIDLNLDLTDLAILRWIADFTHAGRMKKLIIENELYYWIKYDYLIQEMPGLRIKKDTLYRRLKKMVETDILISYTDNRKGVYSYYGFGKNYIQLVTNTENTNVYEEYDTLQIEKLEVEGSEINPRVSETNPRGIGDISEGGRKNFRNKDSSIKDSSIKDSSIKKPSLSALKFDQESEEYKSALFLKEKILENNPKARVPKTDKEMDKWSKDIDLLHRIDERSFEDIKKVVIYAHNDNFWMGVILSPTSLRKNFDKLYLRSKTIKQSTNKKWEDVEIGEWKDA